MSKRCKIYDRVVVIKGPAAGAVGRIIHRGFRWDWLVAFERQVPAYVSNGEEWWVAGGFRVDALDEYLCPLPPDSEADVPEAEREVVA